MSPFFTSELADGLVEITVPVDPHLEITEITDRVSKRFGPALLFRNVIGSEFPVLINQFGSDKRMCMSLEVDSLDEPWAQPMVGLPIERAVVAGAIADEQGKYNLNNLLNGTQKSPADMEIFRRLLASLGLDTITFNFLYTEKKKGPPDRMPRCRGESVSPVGRRWWRRGFDRRRRRR